MKNKITKIAICLFVFGIIQLVQAQAPQKMSYQAVIRDSGNTLLATANVGIKISILQGSSTGIPVYEETQIAVTNTNGLVSLEIGNGTPVTGTFSNINWGSGDYYIKTETDPTGGNNYTIAGTSQLLSVPYALYANATGNSNLKKIEDTDGNTIVEVEKTANDDKIRFSSNGTEYFNMNKGTIEVLNNGNSVFIGKQVGLNEDYNAGNQNVGVGFQALKASTNSFNNVAVGSRALWSQAGGGDNVALGTDALRTNDNYQNIAVGSMAGAENNGLGNVFLGNGAGQNELGNNQLYISNSNTITPLIKGDFATKKVAINDNLEVKNIQLTNGANNGYLLQSDASGNATWVNPTTLTNENDPKVASSITNSVAKWNGTVLTDSQITDNGTNVGVGTTSPSSKLEVNGDVKINTNLIVDAGNNNIGTISNGLAFGSNGSEGIASNRSNLSNQNFGLDFYTNSQKRMYISKEGKVSIGSNEPYPTKYALAIGDSYDVGFNAKVFVNATGGLPLTVAEYTNNKGIMIGKAGNDIQGLSGGLMNNYSNLSLNKNGGNVGIGTATPGEKLDVAGNIKANGGLILDTAGLNNSDGVNILRFGGASSGEGIGSSRQITNNNKGLDLYTNNEPRVSIANWGGVGIGTLFPANKLDVNGNLAIGTNYAENQGAPTNGAIIEGAVGIGTANPTAKLDVNGSIKGTLLTLNALKVIDGANAGFVLQSDATGYANWVNPSTLTTANKSFITDTDNNTKIEVEKTPNEDKIVFTQNGTEYHRMNKATLEFNNSRGNIYLGNASGLIDPLSVSTDNIGLGANTLQNITASIGNIAIGKRALQTTTAGGYNVVLGHEAMKNKQNGGENVAIGLQTGLNNETGIRNTFLGANTGSFNNGSNNVFIGYGAGYNETGDNKLIIKNSALASQSPLIEGDFSTKNVKINDNLTVKNFTKTEGASNGYILQSDASGNASWINPSSITTAENDPKITSTITNFMPKWDGTKLVDGQIFDNGTNIGIGTNSPLDKLHIIGNTRIQNGTLTFTNPSNSVYIGRGTGSNDPMTATLANTSIGINSMLGNTTGQLNVAFGYNSLFNNNVNGTAENTAIGSFSLYGNSSGTENTALGSDAGYNNISGSKNTFIGKSAGRSATGSGNVLLGYKAGENFLGNNKLIIQNANASSQPIIEGDFTTGNIGLGTSSPLGKLHVVGKTVVDNGNIDFINTGRSVFIGESAGLNDDKSSNRNVFIGHEAGKLNTTGALNVYIGNQSGTNNTGNGNVFIGNTAGNLETNANNKFYLANDFAQTLMEGNFQTGVVSMNGSLGLGTTTPTQAKLVVNGSESIALANYGFLNRTTPTGISNPGVTANYSIYASNRIAASEFNAFSDSRIKNIKGISNSKKDLEILKNIEITDYKLKDSIAKGNKNYKKVIAQQVEKVYPQAVSLMTDVVPDIYKQAQMKNGFITLENNLKVGEKVKIIFASSEEILDVTEATTKGFKINSNKSEKVFVFGRQVNDFHTVDYEALSTLNISATQELLKKIEELQNNVQDLKQENKSLKAEISTLNQVKNDVEFLKSFLYKSTENKEIQTVQN
jgi:Chaperone of endosialidase